MRLEEFIDDIEEDYRDAAKYAAKAHSGQTRSGGKPYISHPVRVANIVKKYKNSKKLDDLMSAAFLHDTIEDTDTDYEQLRKMFGDLVAGLVHELTSDKEKIDKVGKADYLTQKMIGMSSWGLVIKLADRLDNVSDIKTAKTPEWRHRYRNETESVLRQLEQNRELSGTHKNLIAAIRAKLAEIDEGVNEAEGLRTDVPNERWLQDKIEYAKEQGRNSFGAPYFGKVTAWTDSVTIPVSILKSLPGARGEQKNVRKDDLEAIIKIMKDTGKLPLRDNGKEYKPFITVAYNGEAWVSEGNHRIMAAAALGWKELPIELRYFDGGERIKDSPLYPGKIGLSENVTEGYRLQLERDPNMYVLHITDTNTGKRTEVRGKSGYETDGYDPHDRLHQLLDKIGKTTNISELMNGNVVGINPKHPIGPNAERATKKAFNELTFKGSQCTKDCSGHRAGYDWTIRNPGRIPNSRSPSFNKGSAIRRKETP